MDKLLKILMEINPDCDYTKEMALIDEGVFDSLEVMFIVNEIEESFQIEIDPDDIVAENFNSAVTIMKLIEKYQK